MGNYPQQATSWLAMLPGGVAVLLTTSGMYGILSYLISQRTREIGIRIALGASRGSVAGFMLSGCAKLSAVSIPGIANVRERYRYEPRARSRWGTVVCRIV